MAKGTFRKWPWSTAGLYLLYVAALFGLLYLLLYAPYARAVPPSWIVENAADPSGASSFGYLAPPGFERGVCLRDDWGRSALEPLFAYPAAPRAAALEAKAPRTIGEAFAAVDYDCLANTLEFVGNDEPIEWSDAAGAATYRVTPLKTYRDPGGRYCRDYVLELFLSNQRALRMGGACRGRGGGWEFRDPDPGTGI